MQINTCLFIHFRLGKHSTLKYFEFSDSGSGFKGLRQSAHAQFKFGPSLVFLSTSMTFNNRYLDTLSSLHTVCSPYIYSKNI